MIDGFQLRQTWYAALNEAEENFKQLISSSSSEWKRLVSTSTEDISPTKKGKNRLSSSPRASDVIIYRRTSKSGGDIYRLVLEIPTGDENLSLEPWKAVVTTPELRQEWDPAVEEARILEMFDRTTRVCKTKFSLGWPANPRDAITISRTFHDPSTLIDISTSLPRSSDEPAYLRPSPPHVRSHVKLFAWCIQHIQSSNLSAVYEDLSRKKSTVGSKLRITCFWEHDFKAMWGFFPSSGIIQHLSTMILSLLDTVMNRGNRVPTLVGYGYGVSIERIRYQVDRAALTIDYSIIPEDEDHIVNDQTQILEDIHHARENRRLGRSLECILPSVEGWDVQVSVKGSSQEMEKLPWTAHATRTTEAPMLLTPEQILLRLSHAPLTDEHSALKVKLVIEISGGTRGLRINGLTRPIHDNGERYPSSYIIPQKILQDIASTANVSVHTSSSVGTLASATSTGCAMQSLTRQQTGRSPTGEKTILSRVRRNYIYFSSLLQEPEAKWKRTTDARGVSITQLDSIDPTLVVYRAEATFVGVGLWDLFGAVISPGARSYWEKQHEDAILLEDVNELTELWHYKTKPAWPVNGRDSVVLKTVYKSPTTIHVFSFSADDSHLFPCIPPADPNIIRTQVDLQGWAIEALSPTTVLLTLLEQSDPKGWTNKTSIPTQMINSLAGIGEFVIKCGGPPIVTRLSGAKMNSIRYDQERMNFKMEYEASISRQCSSGNNHAGLPNLPNVECEIRCDIDTWATSIDIVVDPPPQTISCLRRHRLSTDGGGLWINMSHDLSFLDDDRLLAIVRRATGKEKGVVMVNGARVHVDVEELLDHEIKLLTKRKRIKPHRIPLDQAPVMGVIRRRRDDWSDNTEEVQSVEPAVSGTTAATNWASAPRLSSPLTRFLTYAVGQAATTTQQAIAAMSPAGAAESAIFPSPLKDPIQYALEALSWTQEFNTASMSKGWVLVSDKGVSIHRKTAADISPFIPVHKGTKVIESVSAEELASVIQEYNCRKSWDEHFDSAKVLESFGAECKTSFLVAKSIFPFRDRGFYLASVLARGHTIISGSVTQRNTGEVADQSSGTQNAIFCVSTSFSPDSAAAFAPAKYNTYQLPIGRVYIDAWILETLDPYTKENYAIPSTRCTRLVAIDYAGSIPAAVNSMINNTLARSILNVEAYMTSVVSLPTTRLPTPGFMIMERKGHDRLTVSTWRLRRRNENCTLIGSRFKPDSRTYSAAILVTFPSLSPDRSGLELMTPRTSRIMATPNPPSRGGTMKTGESKAAHSPHSEKTVVSGDDPVSLVRRERLLSVGSDNQPQGRQAFTSKGELRPSTDLLVAEIVIDSKMYPDGYEVKLRSKMRAEVKIGLKGQYISLNSPPNTAEESVLPLNAAMYTMPSSPLHSSGLKAEAPPRHLLRLLLPTAQYQISTVKDPLTGETQSAPPKPPWLVELQQNSGGAVVYVEVFPRAGEHVGGVRVNEKDMVVASEKDSLTHLGREELLDDRTSRMSVLTRISNEAEPLPETLRVPIAIADDLFDPSVLISSGIEPEAKPKGEKTTNSTGNEDALTIPRPETPPMPHVPHATANGGLLGFLQSYPNPLTRFTGSVATIAPLSRDASASVGPATTLETPNTPLNVPGGLVDIDGSPLFRQRTRRMYPQSTIVVVALIAFLVGSLLRSLLSPADFVYVLTDPGEAEASSGLGGWREMQRLFELKYVLGGWDIQVAAIRRH